MKLLVVTDAHIFKTPDGAYWCGAIYSYQFWQRYLEVFQSVRVAARVKKVEKKEEKWKRVDGNNIELYEIPFYQGPIQLLKKYISIQLAILNVYDGCDAALFRMPSPTAQLLWRKRKKANIPTALEVVYDLTDALEDESISLLTRTIYLIQSKLLLKACFLANGVSYVTEKTIQVHYPSYARIFGESFEHFESSYSTITLGEAAYDKPQKNNEIQKWTLAISDVAMNGYRKGEHVFIKVIQILRNDGFNVNGVIMGDGSKRLEFENLAAEFGVSEYIKFTGLISSSEEVRKELKNSDIFFFPTVAEGLPRSVLEAMAVGLPVVTSPVGGIPEIIQEELLAKPTDVDAYVRIIKRLITDKNYMQSISLRNFEISKRFANKLLQEKRNIFYSKLERLCNKR